MSKLEELIKKFCPNGVEYKKLGELGKFYGGLSGKSKNDFTNGNEKFITYKNVYANPSLNLDIEDRVKINPGERQNTLQYGDIIFTGSSETPDECGFSSVITTKTSEKLYLNSFCFFFRLDNQSILLPDFAKHLFRAESIRYQIGKTASGVTRYNVSKDKMKQVQIPLPALPVQREIVRILDSFTLYSAELTAELTARRKQYEFYRDKLLNFDGGNIQRVKLKDIATEFYRGYGITREQVTNEGIPCVRYGEIYTTYNTWFDKCISYTRVENIASPKYFEYGDILFAITGESVEDIAKSVAYIGNEKCLAGGDIVVMKHRQNPKFLAYALSTSDARQQKSKGKIKSKVVHSNVPSIENIEIYLPPIEVQERIVKVLDNFDAICSDLGIGLPAEIEKRQKQYDYYREKLLTFDGKYATILTERNGTERNGTERNGTERNGTERNGTERNGTERNGTERNGQG